MFSKIEMLCKKNGITVTALEKKLGFGRCTISKWKESSPSVDKLKTVADYFGCTIDELINEQTEEKEVV